jgi:hypothetical protein
VSSSAVELVHLEDRDDVDVAQPDGRARFAHEPLAVVLAVLGKDLYRGRTIEPRVLGKVERAHAPRPSGRTIWNRPMNSGTLPTPGSGHHT